MKLRMSLMMCMALASDLAQAQVLTPLQVRSLAASCSACHGTQVQLRSPLMALAGQPKEQIAQKMLDFKAGRLPAATVMHQLAKGYSDEEIDALASYFAMQKR